jgi:hypothetical protein
MYVNDGIEPRVKDQARAWACPALRVSVRLANRNVNLLITCLKGTRLSYPLGRQASPRTCYLTSLAVYLRCQGFPRIPPGDPHTATTQVIETVLPLRVDVIHYSHPESRGLDPLE